MATAKRNLPSWATASALQHAIIAASSLDLFLDVGQLDLRVWTVKRTRGVAGVSVVHSVVGRKQPVAQLSAGAQPWLLGGLTVMFASGIPLFLSEAVKCFYSFPFWVKMTSLLLALLFTFTVRRRVARTGLISERPLPGRLTALISLSLWFGVAWGGRWIGFS